MKTSVQYARMLVKSHQYEQIWFFKLRKEISLDIYYDTTEVFDRIKMSDAMRIVVKLIEETIGKIILRDTVRFKEDVVKKQDDKAE